MRVKFLKQYLTTNTTTQLANMRICPAVPPNYIWIVETMQFSIPSLFLYSLYEQHFVFSSKVRTKKLKRITCKSDRILQTLPYIYIYIYIPCVLDVVLPH